MVRNEETKRWRASFFCFSLCCPPRPIPTASGLILSYARREPCGDSEWRGEGTSQNERWERPTSWQRKRVRARWRRKEWTNEVRERLGAKTHLLFTAVHEIPFSAAIPIFLFIPGIMCVLTAGPYLSITHPNEWSEWEMKVGGIKGWEQSLRSQERTHLSLSSVGSLSLMNEVKW